MRAFSTKRPRIIYTERFVGATGASGASGTLSVSGRFADRRSGRTITTCTSQTVRWTAGV